MRLKDHFFENSPEYLGLLVAAIGILLAALGFIELPITSLTGFSSLVTQMLATYSGLVLTSYTVFHGMRINSRPQLEALVKNLSTEEQGEVNSHLDDIHTLFKQSIKILAGSTLFGCLVYLVTMLNLPIQFDSLSPSTLNGMTASILFALFTTGTLNVFGAVACLYDLRGT